MRKELLFADILAVEESICQRVGNRTGAKSLDIHTLCAQKEEKNEGRAFAENRGDNGQSAEEQLRAKEGVAGAEKA